MQEQEFRIWLVREGQAGNSVESRTSNLRRIEQAYGDLDQLDEAGFDALARELSPTEDGNNLSRIAIQGDVVNGLATLRSALAAYRRYRFGPQSDPSQADRIREFVKRHYADPARRAGRPEFEVVSGDVHARMGLSNAMPAVCAAIESRKFGELVGAELADRQGPHRSSTVRYRFAFAAGSADWAFAELVRRYGAPISETKKMAGFALRDGRQLALDREAATPQLWVEDDPARGAPPVERLTTYLPAQNRHSNLPPRLNHNPSGGAAPRPVTKLFIDSPARLAAVLDWYEGHQMSLNQDALEQLRRIFLARNPGFTSFREAQGRYWEEERSYKNALISRAQEICAAPASAADDRIGSEMLDLLLGKTDLYSNLIDWRAEQWISSRRAAHPGVLEAAAGKLVRSQRPDEAIGTFVQEVWPILNENGSNPYGNSRTLPTMMAALAHPNDAYGVNSRPFNSVAVAVAGSSLWGYNPLTTAEYSRVMELARGLFAAMEEWGWAPKDLWDVQGFVWMVRNAERDPAEAGAEEPRVEAAPAYDPTNLILYGPPGTGKTYATAREAVRLCRPDLEGDDPIFSPENRDELLAEYARLREAGQIDFVTFHQSYSYEDFVEGLRPPTGDEEEATPAGLRLDVRPGLFRNIVNTAEQAWAKPRGAGKFDLSGRQVFKMSLGRAGLEDHIYEAALDGDYVVLGWGGEHDWSDARFEGKGAWQAIFDRWKEIDPETSPYSGHVVQLWRFRASMRVGDIVVISSGSKQFRAIGEVVGPYRYDPTGFQTYNHRRAVRWLWKGDEPLPVDLIYGKPFTQSSCYLLREDSLKREGLARLLPSEGKLEGPPDQFVLIIDEINRANISKVFGELITLIERDKRLGMPEQLKVRLPYSGKEFGVPANLHIVGTMNTADRSIALLDTALRRRFRFKEVAPEPDLPEMREAERLTGIPLPAFLRTINDRIEYLLDREHRIGHAFFINCRTAGDVHAAMRDAVIPLLQEYFFEDWGRVAAVLGEGKKGGNFLACREIRDPFGEGEARQSWSVLRDFDQGAYARCIAGKAALPASNDDPEADAEAAA